MQIIEKAVVALAQPRNRSVLWVDVKEEALKWCSPHGWRNVAGLKIDNNITNIFNRLDGHDEIITEEANKLTDLIRTVYTNHVYASITVKPSMIYKNEATEVTINYSGGITGSKEVPEFTVKKNGVPVEMKDGGTETLILNDATNSVKYVVTASAGGVSKSADATVYSYWPVYTFSSKSDNIDAIPDTAKKEAVMSSPKGKTFTFNVNQDEYIYMAMPDGMSINGGTSSGFDVGLKYNKDITVLDKGVYHIYRTMQKQDAGTYNISIN